MSKSNKQEPNRLETLQALQDEVFEQLIRTTNSADYQRLAKQYSELAYAIECEQNLITKNDDLKNIARLVRQPSNIGKRGLNK